MDTDIIDISTDHTYTANPTMTGAAAVTEGTHHTPNPATAVACTTLWLTDGVITTCTDT